MENLYDEIHRRYGNADSFVEGLRQRLREHGVTQVALAARAGVNKDHLNRVMQRAVKNPSTGTMVLLDEALDELITERETTDGKQ